jgi:hypothetical protein
MTYSPNHFKITIEELQPLGYFEEINPMTVETFASWKKQVDQILLTKIPFTSDDLPDAAWADYHEDGLSPVEAIDSALDDAWYDDPDLETLLAGVI